VLVPGDYAFERLLFQRLPAPEELLDAVKIGREFSWLHKAAQYCFGPFDCSAGRDDHRDLTRLLAFLQGTSDGGGRCRLDSKTAARGEPHSGSIHGREGMRSPDTFSD
jgi:hypothetical protein